MTPSFKSLTIAALATFFGVHAAQNQLQQVTGNIGANPNNVGMYVYKPTKLAKPTPLIVAIHYCTGSAQAYFSGTQYANLADTQGFIVIYPDSPRSGKCFDVNTPQTLSHNGGGDSQGIASMVSYAIANYGVDAAHVYVTGTSSGAMMTNVMAGSYPNLFQAASAYSGVPFGCFAGASDWNSQCANGQLSKTAQAWGDQVRAAYPGYTGSRPKFMIWHGTADTTLYYANFAEEIKQWTNVFGLTQTPAQTIQNDPQSGYTHTLYGCPVVVSAYSAQGVGHTVPVHESVDLSWFGLTPGFPVVPGCSPSSSAAIPSTSTTTSTSTTSSTSTSSSTSSSVTSASPSPSTTTTTTTSTPPPPPPPTSTSSVYTGQTASHWDQCAGQYYNGPTVCAAPYTCKYSNPYYSQCL